MATPDIKAVESKVSSVTSKVDPTQALGDAVNIGSAVADAKSSGKPWYQSKTLWANVLMAAAHYVGLLPAQYAVPVAAGVNIALRFVTTQPLTK